MKAKLICEIGESNLDPFPYFGGQYSRGGVMYRFNTHDGKFFAYFEDYKNPKYTEFQFDFGKEGQNGYQTLNSGELFKTMSTIISICRDFIKKYDPEILHVLPKTDFELDTRRINLFKKYFLKNFDNSFKMLETIHPGTKKPALVFIKK